MTRESPIVAACLRRLALRRIRAWRQNSGCAMMPGRGGKPMPVRFGEKGAADITGILRSQGGRRLEVECKRPLGPRGGKSGREQSDDQRAFQAMIEEEGGLYLLVRSADELDEALRAEGIIK